MLATRFPTGIGRVFLVVPFFLALASSIHGDAPAGYYDSASQLRGAALHTALHEIIDDHQRFPYTSTATDTWDLLSITEEDPDNAANVVTIYRNTSVEKSDHTQSTGWNREHTWPSSYGFPADRACNYPYSDIHHLRAANPSYNSSRGNRVYDSCTSGCTEYPAEGLAVSNWGIGTGNSGSWQVREDRRGDIARSMFYLDVRYQGGVHGTTGCAEPDLILTDDRALIVSDSSSNRSVAYMGVLSTLIEWHLSDPVDQSELARNDLVYEFQGNRNPFIDHPEYVCEVFACQLGDTTPPAPPAGLAASPADCRVLLGWSANSEPDLAGYDIYRSDVSGGPYARLNDGLVLAPAYEDADALKGVSYRYVVAAVDTSGNDSDLSGEVIGSTNGTGTCGGVPTSKPWINEIHYDNSGRDIGEGVEVGGPAGLDLSGWELVPYNGRNGRSYRPVTLTGTLPDQSSGFGTLWFPISRLQNGARDGVALVDDQGSVVQLLSYEGSLTATNGAASGMSSTDIGVNEPSGTAAGESLQLAGSGAAYDDFSWQTPASASPGAPNPGQTFTSSVDTHPPAAPRGITALAGDATVTLDWLDGAEADLAGYHVFRSTDPGGPHTQVNTTLLLRSDYSDFGAVNGTAYFYVVRAVDTSGNISGDSLEAGAVPRDVTAPAVPTGLVAFTGDGTIDLDWNDGGETDLSGYQIYRATFAGGPYTTLNATLLTVSNYVDADLQNGLTYYYVVTALDTSGNESLASSEVSGVPLDTTAPAAPLGLVTTAGDAIVSLDWADSPESDLAGYNVYAATVSAGPFERLNDALLPTPSFLDDLLTNDTTYFYSVTAVDTAGNESAGSAAVAATPRAPTAGTAWINELHYDNSGADVNEGVEIAGTAGLDLVGWTLELYNGSSGTVYRTVTLRGALPNQGEGIGALWFDVAGLQNGSPDGLALVDPVGRVVEFSSYEGTLTAAGGSAQGLVSTDIGVSEGATAAPDSSLQLSGSGTSRDAFAWDVAAATPGLPNRNQFFGTLDLIPPAAPSSLSASAGDGVVLLDWADSVESDLAGYNVYVSTVPGGPYLLVTSVVSTLSSFEDVGVVNGLDYHYVVTALDATGNESEASTEASATPGVAPNGLRFEAGVAPAVGGAKVTIALANVYESPVVVTSVNYSNNTAPVVTRVSNLTPTSFDIRLQNPGDLVVVAAERVHYLVVEEGVWTLPDGRAIEAQVLDSTVTDGAGSWNGQARSYLSSYTTPVVLGQVMTENDLEWSTFWCSGGSRTTPPNASTLVAGKTVCEDSSVARAVELLGVVVIEAGTGVLAGKQYSAGVGTDTVLDVTRSPPYEYSLSPAFPTTPGVALVTQAAVDGGNGGWAYLYGDTALSPTALRLAIDEDQIKDTERRHTTEQVGYIVFQEPIVYAQ